MNAPEVLVVGGGVAGLSAAIELAERGLRVTVLERADSIGGKVRGWHDPQGRSLEHGLHGWWLEYTNFRDLLARLGITASLTPPVGPFTLIHRDGVVDRLTFSNLPSPFHTIGLAAGLKSVGVRGLVSSLRAGLAIAAFDPETQYATLDNLDFRSWMRRTGVSASAARALFEPTLRSNLFLPLEQMSAAAGINAILRGLRRRDSWRFSWLRGNPSEYLWEPMAAYLLAHGGSIALSTQVTGLDVVDNRVTALQISDANGRSARRADFVVLAIDIESCKELVRQSLQREPFFNRILNLFATDVLVTRTWFQGDVRLTHHDGMLIGFRIVDAFIEVGSFQPALSRPGSLVIETQSYLAASWIQAPEATIRELVLRDLSEALPELADTHVERTEVLRHRGLFTGFGLGFETSRPTSETPIHNLFMAGDWVRARQPVMFMENAVTTGRHAASGVLVQLGQQPVPIVPLPPADWPVTVIHRLGHVVRRGRRLLRQAIGLQHIDEGAAS